MNPAELSPEAIDTLRARVMDDLDEARRTLNERALEAAMPGGDDQPMLEAEREVEKLELKLRGLAHGRKQVEEAQRQATAAQRASERRETAVDIHSLIYRRQWAAERLDQAFADVRAALDEVDQLGSELRSAAYRVWDIGDRRQDDAARTFLRQLQALEQTDIAWRCRVTLPAPESYAAALPYRREAALRAITPAVPEIADAAVDSEGLAAARAARGDVSSQGEHS